MATIHGRSHAALKLFRKHPAALAVYWDYVARTNYENVAWPSLRVLKVDTKWSINECASGRLWLVEHRALERIEGYVRPEWRKLEAKKLKRRLSLDHSEYYRPTGTIEVGGKVYQLLYEAAKDNSDVSSRETSHDDSPRTISYAGERRPRESELDSITELDSKKIELTTTTGTVVVVEATETEIAAVFKAYEANMGLLTPAIRDGIVTALSEVPPGWVVEAIVLATQKEKRFWKYADGIIKNWRREGKDASAMSNGNGHKNSAAADGAREALDRLTDELAAALPDAPPADYLPDDDEETRVFAWQSTGRRATAREQAAARLKESENGNEKARS